MAGRLFFVYAPPLKGVKPSKRKSVQPPYSGAPSYKCSVYYFWWEYLRRNDKYRKTCHLNGKRGLSSLYEDFGDVFADDFWTWWRTHAELFAEPKPRYVDVTDGKQLAADTLLISVPLENKASLSVRQFKRLIEPHVIAEKRVVTRSRAKYPVATKPHLPSLYQHLKVWDARLEHPSADYWELADIAGVAINHAVNGMSISQLRIAGIKTERAEAIIKRRKQLAVQRHLRIAKQYIENVGKGHFPLRESR